MNNRNQFMPPGFIVRVFAIAILGCAATLCGAADSNPSDMTLWYRQPATAWLQAMPLGNGMIGAMVFGGVPQERIALNESSFWSGRPHNYDNPEAFQYFPQIRDLVFADKFQEAEKMANAHFWGKPKAQEAYQPIGDLLLDFGATHFTDYRRELDMETGIAKVSYRLSDAVITRETFVSWPDRVLVVRVSSDRPGVPRRPVSRPVSGDECRRAWPSRRGRNLERPVCSPEFGDGWPDCADGRQRPALRGGVGRPSRRRPVRGRRLDA